MTQDENKAESGEFRPTLSDTLYSSLKLHETEGQVALLVILLDELLNVLIKREALSKEELRGILDGAGERVRAAVERAKRKAYEATEGKGYPESYVNDAMDRSSIAAEEILSGIRDRLVDKPGQ